MQLQPLLIDLHYLPCLEYCSLMLHHKEIYLEANESYIKGSYRNKTNIVTANGLQTLSIPLKKGKHQQKGIQSVEISESENWRRQHWRSLKTAYQSAPYWDDYAPEIEPLSLNKNHLLWDYNWQLLEGIIDILQLDVQIHKTNDYRKEVSDMRDLRQQILPKNQTQTSPNIQIVAYEQVFADRQDFIPNASILDLLFCKGPESSLILENMII